MKKITMLIAFLIITIALIGCSSEKKNIRDRQGFIRNQNISGEQWQGRNLNLTEEERQKLFEERQQKAIESCQEKNEGDSCILESPRGEIKGVCKMMDENLVCTMDRPEGPIRQRIE